MCWTLAPGPAYTRVSLASSPRVSQKKKCVYIRLRFWNKPTCQRVGCDAMLSKQRCHRQGLGTGKGKEGQGGRAGSLVDPRAWGDSRKCELVTSVREFERRVRVSCGVCKVHRVQSSSSVVRGYGFLWMLVRRSDWPRGRVGPKHLACILHWGWPNHQNLALFRADWGTRLDYSINQCLPLPAHEAHLGMRANAGCWLFEV